MNKKSIRSILAIFLALTIAFFVAKANEAYAIQWNGYSVYLMVGVLAFVINWIVFIPSYISQTEKYYDLTGSLTYLSVLASTFIFGNIIDNPRAILVAVLVGIWTIRLGSFLFARISNDGGRDHRFDDIKPNFFRFLTAWSIQALWVFLTLCAGLAVLTSTKTVEIDIYAILGLLVWLIGFGIEVTADSQKNKFKTDLTNKGRFISTGLWAYSRHPNYFGEIILWTGIFIIAVPVLEGWQWITIISPIFVYLLLNYVSGINLLEKIADDRWGGNADYEAYKARTSVLVLRPRKG